MPMAANDAGSAPVSRETRIVSGRDIANPGAGGLAPSRARGIGSRFKSAPVRQKETLK